MIFDLQSFWQMTELVSTNALLDMLKLGFLSNCSAENLKKTI
jgi:hypothetical protein